MIDLRSDTVTKPSAEMLQTMFTAELGDDVFSEDPTVNFLQKKAAEMFGMEAGLFCSSGTQTNQIAINVHVNPGGEVVCAEDSHIYKYEGGGIAKNSGASVRLIKGDRGRITSQQIEEWINPDDIHFPVTQLISLEDTFNRGGGAMYDFNEIIKIRELSIEKKIPLHLDGARLFNSLVETKIDFKEYASQFDSISICLSKSLGAPIGSILLGNTEFIKKVRRVRKVFGGGMRQAGIIAAAGVFALENNIERLKIDNLHAKLIGNCLANQTWISSVVPVETNIVVGILKEDFKRDLLVQKLAEENIKIMAFGPGMIRMVTHLDISESDVEKVIEKLSKITL
jgi:threonine aldolase